MKTILALIDFSDITPKVVDHAHAIAQAFGGGIVLMHVVAPQPLVVDFEPPAVPPDVFDQRQKELSALRDALVARGVTATAHQYGGEALDLVLGEIEKLQPDLIILGSHGHGALFNLIVGSVTAGVLKHATMPVLVVPSERQQKPKPAEEAVAEKTPAEEAEAAKGALGATPAPL